MRFLKQSAAALIGVGVFIAFMIVSMLGIFGPLAQWYSHTFETTTYSEKDDYGDFRFAYRSEACDPCPANKYWVTSWTNIAAEKAAGKRLSFVLPAADGSITDKWHFRTLATEGDARTIELSYRNSYMRWWTYTLKNGAVTPVSLRKDGALVTYGGVFALFACGFYVSRGVTRHLRRRMGVA